MQHFRFKHEIFDCFEKDFDCVFFCQSWNLNTFLDLWFLFFAQTIKRQNFWRRVDKKSENLTKFNFLFSCNYFFLFVRHFEKFLSRLLCAHHQSNFSFASRCRYDVNAFLILMRFRFRHEFRSRHNCIDYFVNARWNEICKNFYLFNDI